MQQDVREGLRRVLSDTPVRTGYVEAMAGLSTASGAFGRLEAGYRPLTNLGLFGFGQLDRSGYQAGVGARLTF